MYFAKKTPQNFLDQEHVSQVTQRELPTNQPQPQVTVENVIGSLGGGIAFTLIWVGLLLLLVKIFKKEQNGQLPILDNPQSNLPCHKCVYFSQNHYLKCAVQPSIVLTEESMNCSDFCPQNLKDGENKEQVEQQKNIP